VVLPCGSRHNFSSTAALPIPHSRRHFLRFPCPPPPPPRPPSPC
jgi:hypothetical protein